MKIKARRVNIYIIIILVIAGIVLLSQSLFVKKDSVEKVSEDNNRQYVLDEKTLNEQDLAKKTVQVVVDFGDGKRFEQKVDAETAYDALEKVVQDKGLQIASTQYKYGLMVDSIGQATSSADYYWLYSINGKPGQIAADRYYLQPNDNVQWKYTKN